MVTLGGIICRAVSYCALIGMPQAAAYIIQAAFEQGLSTSWWMKTESAQVSKRSE